jgi:hypothetical protein
VEKPQDRKAGALCVGHVHGDTVVLDAVVLSVVERDEGHRISAITKRAGQKDLLEFGPPDVRDVLSRRE